MTDLHLDEARQSMVQVRIGNRTYDAVREPRCMTCMHPARMEIEEKLLLNHSYTTIARAFSEVEYRTADGQTQVLPKVTWGSIRNHFHNGHMPIGTAALRELSERRARQIGVEYETMSERFVDHYTAAQAVLQRGHERLVAGEIEPDVKDTLAAAKLVKEIEDTSTGSVDAETWSEAMMIYFETAQKLMPPDMWGRFTQALAVNPVLRGITERQSRAQVIEGEWTE